MSVQKFLRSLAENYVFDYGFLLFSAIKTNYAYQNSCFCPMCPRTKGWETLFKEEGNVLNEDGKYKCKTQAFSPNGLIQHLKTKMKEGCWYHAATLEFLEVKYRKFWEGYCHGKSLHNTAHHGILGDEYVVKSMKKLLYQLCSL